MPLSAMCIETLLDKARKHFERADFHSYFKGDEDRVAKAQVALDTAEDAMLALLNYWSVGIGSDYGEKYLRLYGFLQSTFFPQDAISELYRLFVGKVVEPPEPREVCLEATAGTTEPYSWASD